MMTKHAKILGIIISFIVIIIIAFLGYIVVKKIILSQKNNATQPQVVAGRLFYSSFDNKNDIKKFNIIDSSNNSKIKSNWQIKNNSLIQTSDIKSNNNYNPGSMIIINNGSDWQNIESDFSFTPNSDGVFGFITHYQDEKNYYQIYITCNKNLNGSVIQINKIQNGYISTLYKKNICFNLKKENTVKIIVNNNTINLYLNSDKLTIYSTDKNNPIIKGSFGFFVTSMNNISINNLEIKNIDSTAFQTNVVSTNNNQSNQTQETELDNEINGIMNELGIKS